MEQFHYSSQRREEPEDFNLREWPVKGRFKCENTSSRRFSGSYLRSLREDGRSFRSNITISSTASSPGYYSMRGTLITSLFSGSSQFFLSWVSLIFFLLQMKLTHQPTHSLLLSKVTHSCKHIRNQSFFGCKMSKMEFLCSIAS